MEDYNLTGLNFSVQIKATDKAYDSNTVPIRLKKSTIRYMKKRLEPVMLVVYLAKENEAYWIWIKDININLSSLQKTFQIHVPKKHKISYLNWNVIISDVENIFNKKLSIDSPEADTKRLGRYSIEITKTSQLKKEDINEFEKIISTSLTREGVIQKFIELYPKLFLGGEYVRLYSQLILKKGNRRLIPDFFVQNVDGFLDILEIKLPKAKILAGSKRRRRQGVQISSAISQAQEYQEFFNDEENRNWFKRNYNLNVYKPKIILLIGRDSDFIDKIERKRLESNYKNIKIFTYDDLLKIAYNNLQIKSI